MSPLRVTFRWMGAVVGAVWVRRGDGIVGLGVLLALLLALLFLAPVDFGPLASATLPGVGCGGSWIFGTSCCRRTSESLTIFCFPSRSATG